MADLLELIRARRSTRALFDPERLVAMQDVPQILEAARWAPIAPNMQNFDVLGFISLEYAFGPPPVPQNLRTNLGREWWLLD